MPDVVITRPIEADLPAVSALAWPDIAEAKTRQIRLRNWYDLGNLIVCKHGNSVVAFAVVDRSFFDNAFVRMLVVAPSHRRHGIGRRMLEVLAERSSTPKLFTATTESNYAARLLLDSLHWENVGSVRGLADGDSEMFYRAPGEDVRSSRVA